MSRVEYAKTNILSHPLIKTAFQAGVEGHYSHVTAEECKDSIHATDRCVVEKGPENCATEQRQSLMCTAKVMCPNSLLAYERCLERNKGDEEACGYEMDDIKEDVWEKSGEPTTEFFPLTRDEKKIWEECSNKDADCVIRRAFPAEDARFAACLAKNQGDILHCLKEGRTVAYAYGHLYGKVLRENVTERTNLQAK
ncbi:hypothetical protein QOT17_021754 [Balamuthia mandrillaris]